MAIQKAVSGNAYKKLNSATVMGGGNVASTSTSVTNVLAIRSSVPTDTLYGSQVTDSYTQKSISAGKLANMVVGNYIIRTLSPSIAGQASTLLRNPTSEFGQKRYVRAKTSHRREHITSWSYTTGAATKGGSAGQSSSFGADNAFSGTNAIPGELTYMVTGLTPTNDDYKPRYM
jgi:hypothetical protein